MRWMLRVLPMHAVDPRLVSWGTPLQDFRFQSDEFGAERRVHIPSAPKKQSLAGLGALLMSLAVVVPGLPLLASVWGWLGQRRASETPGRVIGWAAVCVGLVMTAVQVAGVSIGWRSWNQAQHGLQHALSNSSDSTNQFLSAFDPAVGDALDPRLVAGYQRMLTHRYGAFVGATCESSFAGVPLLSGGERVPYTLTFENATLQADAELVSSDMGHDRNTWAKLRHVVIHDPEAGAIPFPPPPRAQAKRAPKASAVVAEVPTP